MRKVFVNTLAELAKKDSDIVLMTPDMGFGVLEPFADMFPDRFFNVGIAEQNAINVAAGLALSGKKVYVYSIIPFVTMRCFEQVRLNVAYMNTNVKLVGVGPGFTYGASGATHHAIEDLAIMRALPNMTVCAPGDNIETDAITRESTNFSGPMYIRLAKQCDENFTNADSKIKIGKASTIQNGTDTVIICTGNVLNLAKNYADKFASQNISTEIISLHTLKPIDKEFIKTLIARNLNIITLEEHNIMGGLGSAIAEIIAESGKAIKFKRIGIPDEFSHYIGDQKYICEKFGILDSDLSNFMPSRLKI